MKILGIDPGYGRTGWGIINKQGNSVSVIDFGCFETKPNSNTVLRLEKIYRFIFKTCSKYKPSQAAVEDLFFNTNAKTAMKVGEARGVILVALKHQQLNVSSYTPLQIKTAIVGYGRADKHQVQQMVKTLLKLDQLPRPDDAADALAAALTHAFTVKSTRGIKALA